MNTLWIIWIAALLAVGFLANTQARAQSNLVDALQGADRFARIRAVLAYLPYSISLGRDAHALNMSVLVPILMSDMEVLLSAEA